MIKQYLQIMKPGIIFGNLISVTGGFLLASKGHINYSLFVITLVSITLVIGSGCAFNNYIDRDIDHKMERTRNRVLVKELIPPKISLGYATLLGITGLVLIYTWSNLLSMWLAIIGFIIYVGIYSLYMKRKSIYGTITGGISGAMPPVIGYCTVSNQLDTGALILFLIFILWQIPHSYAIAIFRLKDYQAASIPVLPVSRGIIITKHHIILHIICFMFLALMLTFSGYTGYRYLIIAILVSLWWLGVALQGYKSINNDKIWAWKLFIISIIAITSLSIMMSVDFISPLPTNNLMTYI